MRFLRKDGGSRSTSTASALKTARVEPGPPLYFRHGFTLLELIVVMAIIAILAGLGAGGYRLAKRSARESQAKAEIELLRNALEEYRVEYGAYPEPYAASFSNMISSLPADQQDLMIHSVEGTLRMIDPWGNPYQYVSTNRFLYTIWSTGQDSEFEGDDINPAQSGY